MIGKYFHSNETLDTTFTDPSLNLPLDLVLASTLGSPDTSLGLRTQEKENLAPDICSPPRSSPTDGFLSKEKNKKVCRVHFDIVKSVDYQTWDNHSSTTDLQMASENGEDKNWILCC